jgi:dUTP pyrophosphatase
MSEQQAQQVNHLQASKVTIEIKRLDSELPLPEQAYTGDAGVDLYATSDLTLAPGKRGLIHTGISVAIPEGYAGFVLPRSGLALRNGLSIVNAPGLIDSHYRGELNVIAINLDPDEPITISRGERIAQLVILAVPGVLWQEVSELGDTERGSQGFGSSGL